VVVVVVVGSPIIRSFVRSFGGVAARLEVADGHARESLGLVGTLVRELELLLQLAILGLEAALLLGCYRGRWWGRCREM
jgi:hypothetical protein